MDPRCGTPSRSRRRAPRGPRNGVTFFQPTASASAPRSGPAVDVGAIGSCRSPGRLGEAGQFAAVGHSRSRIRERPKAVITAGADIDGVPVAYSGRAGVVGHPLHSAYRAGPLLRRGLRRADDSFELGPTPGVALDDDASLLSSGRSSISWHRRLSLCPLAMRVAVLFPSCPIGNGNGYYYGMTVHAERPWLPAA